MPPTSDGVHTVGCALEKLIPDADQLKAIQEAVASTHKTTILATELLNIHLRRVIDDPDEDLSCFFNGSWLLNAYNEVTIGKCKVKLVAELHKTMEMYMPSFSAPHRSGIQQCLLYDARNLATVAANQVWMHFQQRILTHVRRMFALTKDEYVILSKDEKRHRKLELMQVATDMCCIPGTPWQSPSSYHAWIQAERQRLDIDGAVGVWNNKPILYHLKTRPYRFLRTMALISAECEAAGGRAFSLYPLRRSYVPRHVRFDQKALRDLLRIGKSEYIKERDKKRKRSDIDDPQSSKRRTKDEMKDENIELFNSILDLRAAGVARRKRFDFAFTTDGVCARLQMRTQTSNDNSKELTSMPKRGIWAIDQLKHVSRLDQLHVVGVDLGKRELLVGVDMDDKHATPIRYTQKQRLRDLRSRQYAHEASCAKPQGIKDAEAKLTGLNSRTSNLDRFCLYCQMRHESFDECLTFYSDLSHRKRRWKTSIKTQQSEARLYKALQSIQKKSDNRSIVLAYGSWGMIAGRAGAACNRGNPPCIGVGLMKKLSKHFVVAPTPEAYTSKTCCRCFSPCGPWEEKESEMGKKIRGLRRCTQRDCMLPLNRDRNAATNIGTNFQRLFNGDAPIRSMSDEDLAFHNATLCLECE
jgi:hypothetical protein